MKVMIRQLEAWRTPSLELLLGRHNHPQCEMNSAGTSSSRILPETRSSGTRRPERRGGNGTLPGSPRSTKAARSTGSLLLLVRAGLPGDGGVASGPRKGRRLEGRRRSTSFCGPTSWRAASPNYCGVCLCLLPRHRRDTCMFRVYSPPPSGVAAASGSAAADSPTGFAGECTPISAPECAAMLP